MENIGIYATKDIDINDVIRDTIKKVNEGMSLMCDTLVAEAEKTTNTLEEMQVQSLTFFHLRKLNTQLRKENTQFSFL